MSKLQTQPVVKCSRDGCDNHLIVTNLMTFADDHTGATLAHLLQAVREAALCEFHQKQRAYYAQAGRLEDWERGNL